MVGHVTPHGTLVYPIQNKRVMSGSGGSRRVSVGQSPQARGIAAFYCVEQACVTRHS